MFIITFAMRSERCTIPIRKVFGAMRMAMPCANNLDAVIIVYSCAIMHICKDGLAVSLNKNGIAISNGKDGQFVVCHSSLHGF